MSDTPDVEAALERLPLHLVEMFCGECSSTACDDDDWQTCATLLEIGKLWANGTEAIYAERTALSQANTAREKAEAALRLAVRKAARQYERAERLSFWNGAEPELDSKDIDYTAERFMADVLAQAEGSK